MSLRHGRQPYCRPRFAGFLGLCCAVLIPFFSLAPPVLHAQEVGQKYWIYLSDKPETQPVKISERALRRRANRGAVRPDWYDRPVSRSYVSELRAVGVEPVVESRWLNAVSAYLSDRARARIAALPFVRRVEPLATTTRLSAMSRAPVSAGITAEPSVGPAASPPLVFNLIYGPSEKQLANINAIEPLENGINGAGVRLGFLDTPYNEFQHPVFDHLTSSRRLIDIRDFAGPQSSTHGLSVASVAVGFQEGALIGPAHGAEVLAAITEYAPTETNQEEDNFVAGLEWLEQNGADVVNVSLGYTTFDSTQQSYTIEDLDGDTGVTTRAADRAASMGVVVVTSAGNSAACGSPENCWYYVGTPADGDSVIAVGAIRQDSTRAAFSSVGPTADGRIKPDVAAPGSSVYVAAPGGSFGTSSGTSFASPLVAGVVCQMLQVNPDLTPIEVRRLLRETASQPESPDNSLGWGIVNAAAAVQRAVALGSEYPESANEIAVNAFPNPATDYLMIHITASAPGRVILSLFDVLGRSVLTHERFVEPGQNAIRLSTRDLPSGLYVYSAAMGRMRGSGKVIVR